MPAKNKIHLLDSNKRHRSKIFLNPGNLEIDALASTMPLVTIITVVYNAVELIEETIKSVINQSYKNIEYLIIDGGSNDGTLQIITRYKYKIKTLISENDAGIYDAMNKGIKLARGDYVGIIGAGDWYEKDAISSAVATFLKTEADVVFGDVEIVDEETGISRRQLSRKDLMPITMSSISHPSTFTRRSLYLASFFDTKFKIAADYNLFLALYIGGYRFEHSQVVHVHIIGGGVSSSFATQKEVFWVHWSQLGVIHSIRCFILSVARYSFYKARRWVLVSILTRKKFDTLRVKWLQLNSKKSRF
ncbi:glycosyltransferase family 2 protein [Polynucleobacter sinensis]|uniref:glycosyltransferase family 2 protein n=1 Tax=Polynucleobacter sinensis TaxID=1743157 RepID=UPI000785EC12|nr:glycosyltransferase family 2 protein [Polynucleobacter sinensis]